jgi:hypothetical protein
MAISNQYSQASNANTWLGNTAGYSVGASMLDEMLDQSGKVRPHWAYYILTMCMAILMVVVVLGS